MAKKRVKATDSSSGDATLTAEHQDLPGIESDRVPAIETTVKKLVEISSQRRALKEEYDTLTDKLAQLMKKNERNQYSCHGKKVVVIPGADEVRLKKAKST